LRAPGARRRTAWETYRQVSEAAASQVRACRCCPLLTGAGWC
jgi:hypothetical protein